MKENQILTLWPEWSYSSIITKKIIEESWISDEIEIKYVDKISDIIKKVGPNILALVPIENRYAWVVSDTMQTIYDFRDNIKIIWWKSLKINHCLCVLKQSSLEKINKVYSHPQALRQCRIKLEKMPQIEQISTSSTNSQIWNLKENEAIICNRETAINAWLQIIDNTFCPTDNITRFALIWSKNDDNSNMFKWLDHDRDILILSSLPDDKWSLAKALLIIAESWISLHFILSLARWDGKYDFPMVIDNWIQEETKNLINKLCLWNDFLNFWETENAVKIL